MHRYTPLSGFFLQLAQEVLINHSMATRPARRAHYCRPHQQRAAPPSETVSASLVMKASPRQESPVHVRKVIQSISTINLSNKRTNRVIHFSDWSWWGHACPTPTPQNNGDDEKNRISLYNNYFYMYMYNGARGTQITKHGWSMCKKNPFLLHMPWDVIL